MGKTSMKGVLNPVKKVKGGVLVSHHKNTADMKVVRIPTPEKIVMPMQQHIGAPCIPTVKIGETVSVGQVIGDSDAYVSAPIHSSISGKVLSMDDVTLPNGIISKAITIESDGEMRLFEGIKPPKCDNHEDFIKGIRASGLVGLGGAGFPTHVKLNLPDETNIDTLIINAAECEPFITVDYREILENTKNIIESIKMVKEFLKIPKVIVAIEDNKPDAFEALREITETKGIYLMKLKSKYPQGAEKMMIQSATGRQIPPGKLPSDVGCMVMNVASIAFIARYFRTGRPLVSRSLTVDGSSIAEPKNVRVPIGTNIRDIIEFCGGFKTEPAKIIAGGPMMGFAIINTDLPVLKQNNAILAFDKNDANLKVERDCIRCGRCASACPMSLMPTLIERYADVKDVDKLSKIGVNVCMECGSCAYACPSGKPLLQHMRLAKSVLRNATKK